MAARTEIHRVPMDVMQNDPTIYHELAELHTHKTFRGRKVVRWQREPLTGDYLLEVEEDSDPLTSFMRRAADPNAVTEGEVRAGRTVVSTTPEEDSAVAILQAHGGTARQAGRAFDALRRVSLPQVRYKPGKAEVVPQNDRVHTYTDAQGRRHMAPGNLNPDAVPEARLEQVYDIERQVLTTSGTVTYTPEMFALMIKIGRITFDFGTRQGTHLGKPITWVEVVGGNQYRVTYTVAEDHSDAQEYEAARRRSEYLREQAAAVAEAMQDALNPRAPGADAAAEHTPARHTRRVARPE